MNNRYGEHSSGTVRDSNPSSLLILQLSWRNQKRRKDRIIWLNLFIQIVYLYRMPRHPAGLNARAILFKYFYRNTQASVNTGFLTCS